IMVMYNGERVEQITPERLQAPTHPYSKLLFSSVPKLDPTWLDSLVRDPELVSQYGHR
ncbi:ABC transporter, partial [Mesorhizobium sp. M7A.F.Ca.US.011.01.1.1]